MSEDWKNKDIPPYLKGKPANWGDEENDWVAFKGNEKLEKELASIKQKQTEILERLDKPIDTQVTGSIVEEVLVDAEAIRDTSSHFIASDKNVGFKSFMIYATSSLDVDLRFNLRPFPRSYNNQKYWDGDKFVGQTNIILPGNTSGEFMINTGFNWLEHFIIYRLSDFTVRLQANEVPTEGSVSVYIVGVKI